MKFSLAALLVCLGAGCATGERGLVKTQIVSYPDGAIVEYNGERIGRAPSQVTLPQDDQGRLNGRAVVRVIPNTEQPELYAQTRVFEPGNRTDPIPNRIMVDMTLRGTNKLEAAASRRETTHVEKRSQKSPSPAVPYVDRGKPTQAVGLDRWNPGKY